MKSAVWVGLSLLLTMGLTLIVFGQRSMMDRLKQDGLSLDIKLKAREQFAKEQTFLQHLLIKQLEGKTNAVAQREEELKSVVSEKDTKVKEASDCQGEQGKLGEEVQTMEKEKSDAEANFGSLKTQLSGDISTLKQQMEQRSKICDFVKKDSDGYKQCNPNDGSPTPESTQLA